MKLCIRIAVGAACRRCVSVGGFDLREVAISEHESIFDVPAEFRRETTYIRLYNRHVSANYAQLFSYVTGYFAVFKLFV